MWNGVCVAGTDPLVPVVCDAGPLIHLDEIDYLDLLTDFPVVVVPEEVWGEVKRHRPRALEGRTCPLERRSLEISTEPEFQALVRVFSLHIGEQAALTCMGLYPEAILLTDDGAARLAARALRYQAQGTIGILLRALRRGQRTRSEILKTLRALPSLSTLHIRSELLQQIIEEVEHQG